MFEDDDQDEKKTLYNKIQNRNIKIIYSQCGYEFQWFNLKTSKSKYLIVNVNKRYESGRQKHLFLGEI